MRCVFNDRYLFVYARDVLLPCPVRRKRKKLTKTPFSRNTINKARVNNDNLCQYLRRTFISIGSIVNKMMDWPSLRPINNAAKKAQISAKGESVWFA